MCQGLDLSVGDVGFAFVMVTKKMYVPRPRNLFMYSPLCLLSLHERLFVFLCIAGCGRFCVDTCRCRLYN
jgi:hypothetical protein